MVEDESDPTPEELHEAEVLARALEGQRHDSGLPRDALETAALLRHARDGGALSPEREHALRQDLRRRARRIRRRRLTVWGGSLALAASLLLFLQASVPRVQSTSRAFSPSAPTPLIQLLQAQARAAAREPGALAALDRAVDLERHELHASLGLDREARP